MMRQIMQIREDLPNHAEQLGYTPTTDYWKLVIRMVNAMIVASTMGGYNAESLQEQANEVITKDIHAGEKTAVEWAEFVMAVNHLLWLVAQVNEDKGYEELQPVAEALRSLYYEWHDKALKTLEGDDCQEYLRITD